jgi:hypothetical protein
MSAQAFDGYKASYEQVVAESIAFSGLKHDFFLAAKVVQLKALFERHFGAGKPSPVEFGYIMERLISNIPQVGKLFLPLLSCSR